MWYSVLYVCTCGKGPGEPFISVSFGFHLILISCCYTTKQLNEIDCLSEPKAESNHHGFTIGKPGYSVWLCRDWIGLVSFHNQLGSMDLSEYLVFSYSSACIYTNGKTYQKKVLFIYSSRIKLLNSFFLHYRIVFCLTFIFQYFLKSFIRKISCCLDLEMKILGLVQEEERWMLFIPFLQRDVRTVLRTEEGC